MPLSAHDAFVRMNRCTVAMMFIRMVHFSTDLSLWLYSPMFWAPSMSNYSRPPFTSSTWKRGGVWMCKFGRTHCNLVMMLLV